MDLYCNYKWYLWQNLSQCCHFYISISQDSKALSTPQGIVRTPRHCLVRTPRHCPNPKALSEPQGIVRTLMHCLNPKALSEPQALSEPRSIVRTPRHCPNPKASTRCQVNNRIIAKQYLFQHLSWRHIPACVQSSDSYPQTYQLRRIALGCPLQVYEVVESIRRRVQSVNICPVNKHWMTIFTFGTALLSSS